jgi:hypothetical protein
MNHDRTASGTPLAHTGAVTRLARWLWLPCLAAQAATAAPFDAATGQVDPSGAALALTFEGAVPAELYVYDTSFRRLDPSEITASLSDLGAGAIEGKGALRFGGATAYALMDLRPYASRFAGRRVRFTAWQRARGTRAGLAVSWYVGDADSLFSTGGEGLFELGQLPFQETGRETDDGWVEVSTGPVDFDFAHALPATALSVFDAQLRSGFGRPDATLAVELDAITIEIEGPAAVPDASCSALDEAMTCGAEGVCAYGRCADAAARLGGRIDAPALRSDYVDRRIFELTTVVGGRYSLEQAQRLTALLAPERTGGTTRSWATAWSQITNLLGDGHFSRAVPSFLTNDFRAGACLYLSDADLLPDAPVAPMVFEVVGPSFGGSPGLLSGRVQPGDVLVALDGLPVREWRSRTPRLLAFPGDPRAAEVLATPDLIDAALATGAVATFARCPQGKSSAPSPCTAGEVSRFDVSLAALAAPIWANTPPGSGGADLVCDFRFVSPTSAPGGGRAYEYAGVADRAGVRVLQINGVPSPAQETGWGDTVAQFFASTSTRALLDHRIGGGGTIDSVDFLASHWLGANEFASMELYPALEGPVSAEARSAMIACNQAGTGQSSCGNMIQWVLGEQSQVTPAGGRGVAANQRLAILSGDDVSGNDFLSQLLTYRAAPTRFFGQAPTRGAFGVIWSLPAYGAEFAGGSFQVHDTIFRPDAGSVFVEDFRTAYGVPPTEIVRQRQSDLLRGVDTVLEAAISWARQ